MIDGWDTCCEIALRRISLDLTDDKSTLVQVMAWCRQATTYHLSQCWPRSPSPYDVTRPQWVAEYIIFINPKNDGRNKHKKTWCLILELSVTVHFKIHSRYLCSCVNKRIGNLSVSYRTACVKSRSSYMNRTWSIFWSSDKKHMTGDWFWMSIYCICVFVSLFDTCIAKVVGVLYKGSTIKTACSHNYRM